MPHIASNNVVSSFILTLLGLGTQGFIFFYYLNNLKNINCDCVNDKYHENIKNYFKLTLLSVILFYSCQLIRVNGFMIKAALVFTIFSHIMLVYNVRHMLVHIRKYGCNCAESMVKEIIDVINILEISFYIIVIVSIIILMTVNLDYYDDNTIYITQVDHTPFRYHRHRHRPIYH